MADEPLTGQVPEQSNPPESGQVPEPTPAPTSTATSTEPAGSTPEPFDEARARRTIEQQRESEKAAKKAAKEAQDALAATQAELKKLQDAALSDEERKAKEFSELQERAAKLEQERLQAAAELQETRTQRAVERLAGRAVKDGDTERLAFHDPETAYQLIDRATLEFDDAGNPTPESVNAALATLAASKPFLVQQPAQAASGNTSTNPSRANANTPQKESDADRRARLYGLGAPSIFDAAAATQRGGGVRWTKPPE